MTPWQNNDGSFTIAPLLLACVVGVLLFVALFVLFER